MDGSSNGEIGIHSEKDLIVARKAARDLAVFYRFGVTDVTRIVTAVSELARNVFRYAGSGVMRWRGLDSGDKVGLEFTFEDHGPGMDAAQCMQEGFTTSGGFGMGLPGAKRLMDDMEIRSTLGEGTTIVVRKWKRRG